MKAVKFGGGMMEVFFCQISEGLKVDRVADELGASSCGVVELERTLDIPFLFCGSQRAE